MKRKILALFVAVALSFSTVELIPQFNHTVLAEAASIKLDVKQRTFGILQIL